MPTKKNAKKLYGNSTFKQIGIASFVDSKMSNNSRKDFRPESSAGESSGDL